MEAKTFKDRTANQRSNYVPIRLSDREVGVVETVKEELRFVSISQTIRELMMIGAAKILEDKEIDSDIINYIKMRESKLATEFKAYGLTAAGVEQERIEEVEKLCEWYYARDKTQTGYNAIEEIIKTARENLKKPGIDDKSRESMDKILEELEVHYVRRYMEV